jgi:AcrR family transcriptional regulator
MKENDKRATILEAANRVVAARGYMRATVEDIAHEAGVAKGTVYLYFEDKPAILVGLAESALGRAVQMVREAAGWPVAPVDKLRRLYLGWTGFVKDHPGMMPFASPEAATIASQELEAFKLAIKPKMRELIEALADIIRPGIASGDLRATDPYMAAVMFIHSFPTIFMVARQGLPVPEPAEAALDILFNGLASRAAPATNQE